MTLDVLAQLGEFVGGFFVLVSLVYLAHQVRQNTKSLRVQTYAHVLNRMSTLQANLSADAELNHIVTVGAQAPERLSPSERIRLSWALYELLGAAEFMYHQAQEGVLPEKVWSRWQETLRWWISHPGIQSWWTAKPTPLSSDFEEMVDDLIRTRPFDDAIQHRWEEFVAGTGGGAAPRSQAGSGR